MRKIVTVDVDDTLCENKYPENGKTNEPLNWAIKKVVAVDFDGTLCENKYPEIGKPNEPLIWALRTLRDKGQIDVILYTCRTGDILQEAIDWCRDEEGLNFDAVNENLPRIIERFGGDTRKIFADIYIDDKTLCLGYVCFEHEFDDPADQLLYGIYNSTTALSAIELALDLSEEENDDVL